MRCPSCDHDNSSERRFCGECGAALAAMCAACGASNGPSEKFCGGCGVALTAGRATPTTRTPATSTPKHLADKILTARRDLEGERKHVTVLFADVKGSMELAEQMDQEEWSRIMQRFFQILSEGVERFEGFVDKFTGDGIMALFGAPIAHEDHARRACYAALHLRDEIANYATELRRQHGVGFSTRMGLNSGAVVVGRIGDDLRMEYTAQGHTVGLAHRMESLAEPNTCFLSAATAQLVAGYFALDDLGEFQVKGVAIPVRVHRLGGIGSLRTRLDVSRARGFSRFVGRGDEMQVLESVLARARDGNAQVVGIVGDAGLGKSRLSFEFLERCRSQNLMTYETTGVAHGKATPLVPILKLFRAFFGITDQDSATTARERIAGRLLLLDENLRASLPLNFDFLGYPDPENPPPKMDPETRQRQMFDIVRRVTQARGQKETQVVLLEDLHWFDAASAAYLEPLIEAAVGTRTLVVLNFRPEFQAPWMGKSYYLQLPLGPLGPDAIRELLDALLGKDASIKGLAEAIHARTAGNPFFTEEVVQNLIETGKLQGSKGAYKLVTPVSKLEVPSSVHALLAARIDRLADREKDVLQTAAVIGREFDEPTLAAVVEQDAPQLREALQMLKDTEFVYEQSLYPVTEYLFKHPLTQEVALASQLQEKRRKLHAAVARVIEAAHAGDIDQQSALLAHHWEQAADLAQAVRWHRRAAEWAGARDPKEGLRHWRKVRELGRALADEEAKDARLRACSVILASGTWRLGMSEDDARSCLDEGRSLAQELGRPSAMAVPLVGFAGHPGQLGRAEVALQVAEEARGMLSDGMDVVEIITVEWTYAYWLLVAGRLPQALEAIDHVLDLTGGDPQVGRELAGFSPLFWAETVAGWTLAQAGRFDECWPRAERAIRMARDHGAQENLGWAIGSISFSAYLARGTSRVPVTDVRRASLEGVEIAEAGGSRFSQIMASFHLAIAFFLNGDYGTCEERFTEALAEARGAGTGLDWQGYYLAVFADACLARGDAEAAIARAREGIAAADAGGAWFQAAIARAVLVDALVHADAPEHEIAAVVTEARELVRKSGGNSLLPRLRESEARLAGRNDRAILAAGLRAAEAMYRAMGAPDPADRLARELAVGR
jgi:class 3 adenylate cyclase/tetratricopeptide (TPR) repeat protein